MTDVHTFTSTIRFCGLFKPLRSPIPSVVRYGCTVNADDVPKELRDYVTPKPVSERYLADRPDLAGAVWCHLMDHHPPQIVLTDGIDAIRELINICHMAEATNVTPDRLLNEIPATLAVRPIEYIGRYHIDIAPKQVKRLSLVAVQVTYDDLVKRFNDLQKEYFR